MDKSAIEQIQTLAVQAQFVPPLGDSAALMHQDFSIKSLEPHQLGRQRLRGEYVTDLVVDFVSFLESHIMSAPAWIPVFMDPNLPWAVAVINYRTPSGLPGHCDFIAQVALKLSAEMKGAQRLGESRYDQKAAAEILEDWAECLTFLDDEGTAIPAAQAINSIRKVRIDQTRSVETEKRQFGAERSEFEKIEASAQQMPSFIEFSVQPHPELERREYRYRVSILASGTEPMFRFTQIAKEIAEAQLLEASTGPLGVKDAMNSTNHSLVSNTPKAS
jgi:uncharacterized protein YfdQ (DUF2303 family)